MYKIFSLILLSLPVQASVLGNIEDRWIFDYSMRFFNSTENFDDAGDIVELSPGFEYSHLRNQISARYDYSQNWSFQFGLELNYAKSVDTAFERTDFAPTDAFLNLDYQLADGFFRLVPELRFSFPIKAFDEQTDEVISNDGVLKTEGRVNLAKDLGFVYMYIYSGYQFRGEGFSNLVTYGWQNLKQWQSFALGGGIKGFTSISDDEDFDMPNDRLDLLGRVNAQSLAYASINPSVAQFDAWFQFFLAPDFHMKLGAEHNFYGENYVAATSFLFGLTYYFTPPRSMLEYRRKRNSFQLEQEVDEDFDVFEQEAIKTRRRKKRKKKKTQPIRKEYIEF